jgi:glutamine amidotransferase
MCRLFGFRSVIRSQVHRSLVLADNALGVQSERHPDGWGVAYYVGGAPHLVKSAGAAISDSIFHRVSGVVASETVLAHVRKATQGQHSSVNTHPFQFGHWIFAHNGNIRDFDELRAELLSRIHPELRRYILGETDSEVLFYLLLTHMRHRGELHAPWESGTLIECIEECVREVTALTGPFSSNPDGSPDDTYLTFILTNGHTMAAHQGGKRLLYSTWKHRCSDRDICPSFAPACEAMSQTGVVNHLIFSSEPLQGDNVWLDMLPGQVVAVDARMRMRTSGVFVPSI